MVQNIFKVNLHFYLLQVSVHYRDKWKSLNSEEYFLILKAGAKYINDQTVTCSKGSKILKYVYNNHQCSRCRVENKKLDFKEVLFVGGEDSFDKN